MKTKDELEKMTLRQVMEYTRNLPIREGSLEIIFGKIISKIEELERIVEERNKEK